MMRNSIQRRIARALLALGIRIAPQHAAQWGEAMLGELAQVKGEWAALFWAVGGAGVLVKHALVALVFPARNALALLPNGGLFAKEGPMRKASLSIIAGCVILTLLFLLAPTFRQGLGLSLMQWRTMSQVNANWHPPTSSKLRTLEKQAETKHDAEALAFVAVRLQDVAESTRLAEEAVQLDPKLTWIYVMASPTPDASEGWIQKLKEWDPQNALPHFMEAENIDIAQVMGRKIPHSVDEESAAWKDAMAAAFASSKLDDYADRLRELDRRVVARYNFNEPYIVMLGVQSSFLPSYTAWDAYRYGESVVKSGAALEARGDKRGALEEYWRAIKFGEVTKSARMLFMYRVLRDAYGRIAKLSEERGDQHQAEYFAFLSRNIMQEQAAQIAEWRRGATSESLTEWNADVMKVAGLIMPTFSAILLICAMTIVLKNRTLRLESLHAGQRVIALSLGSAIGLLMSSALLYVSYWPYAGLFHRFMRDGNALPPHELLQFLNYAQVPLGALHLANQGLYVYYFWLIVIFLCSAALVAIAARHLRSRLRIRAANG